MFTEAIRIVLLGLPGQINITDDIFAYGETKEAHQSNLLAVLKRLEDAGLTLYIDKCQFYKLTFFGLRFTSDGMSPTEDRCGSRTRKCKGAPLFPVHGTVQFAIHQKCVQHH